jgi:putative ABC transport system substrate-binding protein
LLDLIRNHAADRMEYQFPLPAGELSAQTQWVATFLERLGELGCVEGRTVAIEYRWAGGRSERNAEIAAEFVWLKVDVIVTYGSPAGQTSYVTHTYTTPGMYQLPAIPCPPRGNAVCGEVAQAANAVTITATPGR